MKKVILGIFIILFLATHVQALMINFDVTGSGNDSNLEEMDEWGLDPYSEFNSDAGEMGEIFTYQDTSGFFTEEFTLRVGEGRNSVTGENTPFDPFFADVQLDGQYYDDSNIQFNSGSIMMYDDTQYGDNTLSGSSYPREYNATADTKIAELNLTGALTSELSGSLLSAEDLGMKIDLTFEFDYVNPLYFGSNEEYLVGNTWLLAVVGGRIEQENLTDISATDPDYDLLIEWDAPSMQAEFKAVPEPATLVLFGTGLLGLVAFGRKKFLKKS